MHASLAALQLLCRPAVSPPTLALALALDLALALEPPVLMAWRARLPPPLASCNHGRCVNLGTCRCCPSPTPGPGCTSPGLRASAQPGAVSNGMLGGKHGPDGLLALAKALPPALGPGPGPCLMKSLALALALQDTLELLHGTLAIPVEILLLWEAIPTQVVVRAHFAFEPRALQGAHAASVASDACMLQGGHSDAPLAAVQPDFGRHALQERNEFLRDIPNQPDFRIEGQAANGLEELQQRLAQA
mmetsp:Transcript_100834/g.310928  ORF Transcript_100834/g.310928 Transcript_100834/m.310928 type:complete len:246 (-) Transcript_100834:822-1559(-)